MTRKQKTEVDHLRIIGVSASDIASQLGLSVNTVRSYFFSASVGKKPDRLSCLRMSNYDSSEAQTPPLLLGCLPYGVVE